VTNRRSRAGNLDAGLDIDEIVERFHVARKQVQAVLEFADRSLTRRFPSLLLAFRIARTFEMSVEEVFQYKASRQAT
jgi:DNA-binding XRE family transcriptional regulator